MTLNNGIQCLVQYGINTGLLPQEEKIYTTNQLLELYDAEEFAIEDEEAPIQINLEEVLQVLVDYAVERQLIIEDSRSYREKMETRIMNCLVPRPSQVTNSFWEKYKISPKLATDYFYQLSQDSNYIRRYQIAKDMHWEVDSIYGKIEITINLSKPEKDPKEIANALKHTTNQYPKCLLCKESVGYAGHQSYPARQNHRLIPVTINHSEWAFQYSPYVYYNEHCILLNGKHVPMQIERETFIKLLDFIKIFPHYFIGSNADLPIVGGSILTHDHYQGGNHCFAMEQAEIEIDVVIPGYEDVRCGIVKWPLSVLRLQSKDSDRLVDLAAHVLKQWKEYTDESAGIYAQTNGERHNTITPIARKREDYFELDLALRNNRTNELYPDGIFHPHQEKHHIKKENIGLIEVMGLAILPARLKAEMELLEQYLLEGRDIHSCETIKKHAVWAEKMLENYQNITKENLHHILECEIGKVFVAVLEDAGVFKCTTDGRNAFLNFLKTC